MEEYGSTASGASLGEILGAALTQKEEETQTENGVPSDAAEQSPEAGGEDEGSELDEKL